MSNGPVLREVPGQTSDIGLTQDDRRVNVVLTFDNNIGDRLRLNHRFLGVDEHVVEELISQKVLLSGQTHLVHLGEGLRSISTNSCLCVEEQAICSLTDSRMNI